MNKKTTIIVGASVAISVIIIISILVFLCAYYMPKKKPVQTPLQTIRNKIQFATDYFLTQRKTQNALQIEIPAYYINLDRSIYRKEFMENQRSYFKTLTHIPAVNGKNVKSLKKVSMQQKKFTINKLSGVTVSSGELGCMLSHMKAIRTAYTAGDDVALILEDDVCLALHPFWPVTLTQIINTAPDNWGIISLMCTPKHNNWDNHHQAFISTKESCWSTQAYIINRPAMKNIILTLFNDTASQISFGSHRPISDVLLFNITQSFNYIKHHLIYPYNCTEIFTSTIHPSHNQVHQRISNNILLANIQYYFLTTVHLIGVGNPPTLADKWVIKLWPSLPMDLAVISALHMLKESYGGVCFLPNADPVDIEEALQTAQTLKSDKLGVYVNALQQVIGFRMVPTFYQLDTVIEALKPLSHRFHQCQDIILSKFHAEVIPLTSLAYDFEKILPHAYFINLSHRTDRLKNINDQMIQNFNYPKHKLHRIEATKHADGATGCAYSHIQTLKKVKQIEHKEGYVLIIEDDFAWHPNVSISKIKKYVGEALTLPNWDVLLISASLDGKLGTKVTNNVYNVQNAAITSGYVIRNQYIPTLLSLWETDMKERLNKNVVKGNKLYHQLAIDQSWKKLQKRDKWYVIFPLVGIQIASYSDIEKRHEKVKLYKKITEKHKY